MAGHVGIVACSAEGAALCYRTICLEGQKLMGRYEHPEISIHGHSFAEYMRRIDSGDWEGVAALMLDSARRLSRIGADFVISPDNTIHQAFDLVEKDSPIPWLHIARVVAEEAAQNGFTRVGVLGTKYLMEGPVYPSVFEAAGIQFAVPEKVERLEINRIIFEELVEGTFRSKSREYFSQVISHLKSHGCDAVALSCTEIPLLVTPEASPLPTLDSTRLLARAALRHAVKQG